MGNDNGGFHESDEDEDVKVNNYDKNYANNMNGGYLPDPSEEKDENDGSGHGIYQSQYHMNLYGVTDSGEFEHNAINRIPNENHVKKIKQLFKYKKKLGEGASGKVLLVQQKFGDQKKCALKELNRKNKVNAQLFLREVVILESLNHPNILQLFAIYLDKSSYFIATAYYSGGEFFDRIIKIKKFSEKQALKYIKPILKAVAFMHDKAIVHRDIKPSNMVFDKKGKNGIIKIIDFGTSEIVIDDDLYTAERVGTILYAPPEWKKDRIGSHIKKGDLWSLGVIVYVLMVGRLPFGEWKHIEGYNNDLWFPKKLKKKLSYQCIDFILKLLQRYPEQRLSAALALQHPWLTTTNKKQKDVDLGAELKFGLKSVHAENTISRVIGKVNYGALSINDLDKEQRAIVFDNVKNQKDVEKYLAMYNKQLAQQQHNIAPLNQNMAPPMYNKYAPKYHPPPAMRLGAGGLTGINSNIYNKNSQNGGVNSPLFASKDIMESIHMFREQDEVYKQYRDDINGNMDNKNQNKNVNEFAGIGSESAIKNMYNEDLDDEEYEETVFKTLSVMDLSLTEEQKEAELRDMLGADYEELKECIYRQHEQDLHAESMRNNGSGHQRKITHKNMGNPLNIQREEDEEFMFDDKIVEQLMQLGLATKHACVKAVLATESKGVNQAAEWLLMHQNDQGINREVDVV